MYLHLPTRWDYRAQRSARAHRKSVKTRRSCAAADQAEETRGARLAHREGWSNESTQCAARTVARRGACIWGAVAGVRQQQQRREAPASGCSLDVGLREDVVAAVLGPHGCAGVDGSG